MVLTGLRSTGVLLTPAGQLTPRGKHIVCISLLVFWRPRDACFPREMLPEAPQTLAENHQVAVYITGTG